MISSQVVFAIAWPAFALQPGAKLSEDRDWLLVLVIGTLDL